MYDTVAQYGQVLGAEVDDWHPPIMVRLWQLLHALTPGTAPMFVLQAALYALGFGLIVGALARTGRSHAALAAAALGLSPLLLGWQMVVLKDAQMQGALLAAFGFAAYYRLSQRPLPLAAGTVILLFLAYATLVRANAAFATVPLGILLLPRPHSLASRGGLIVAGIAGVLVATPFINHRLLDAQPSNVVKSQPLFDLAAIAAATPGSPSPFTPAERHQIVSRHCVKAFFWDPLGEPTACASAAERMMAQPAVQLYLDLGREAAAHPIAYAGHRLEHWNSTERWLVRPNLPDIAPPIEAEPNDIGLVTPDSAVAAAWQDAAALEAATPFGWPIVWTGAALLLLPAAWRGRGEAAGRLALALLASALTLEASFLVISIASDLRYHLWSMTASPLALMLVSRDLGRREWTAGIAVLALIAAGGIHSRATLPAAPDSYQAMIHAPFG